MDLYYVSGNLNVDSNTTSVVPKQSHKDNKITAPGTTSLSNLIIVKQVNWILEISHLI
ncbi:hypothetical protein [Mycoplasmopsis canis]|uniref:hypothetical protein n=1 Tax=Mycoplasmopsis canis TaxID=29555 RepID=UPI001CB78F23|nr:hypothetical protein [Mycoplasmopsis canis]